MDTLIFVVSKLIGALLRPDTWIIIVAFAIVLAIKKRWHRVAFFISSILSFATLILAVFPIGSLLLRQIENTYPTMPELSEVNGIIVLGGGEDLRISKYRGRMEFNEGGDRFAAAIALSRRFPNAQLMFTGGSGALRDVGGVEQSEASITSFTEQFFIDQGIPKSRLILENRSRNTTENARYSYSVAKPKPEETWVLVTSAFHMPRAMRSFHSAGWENLIAWPVDYRTASFVDGIGWNLNRNLKILNTAVREYIGQMSYRLLGR